MEAGWDDAKNVLCVNFGGLAGVLASTPAIRAIKQSGPRDRRVTLLGTRAGAGYAQHVGEIDEAIAYDAPWLRDEIAEDVAPDLAMRYLLAMRGFDAAVIFTSGPESPVAASTLCRLAGIPLQLASAASPESLHPARSHLDLVATIGARTDDECLSFRVRPQATWRARLKLEEAGVEVKKPMIAVHPGAQAEVSRWSAASLAFTARELSTVLESQLAILGGAADRELAESIRRNAGDTARSLAGSLTFDEFAATLEIASLVISNDADTTHLAAAVGTPVVDLRGDPRYSPWMVANRVIEGTSVEEAVAATCDLWLDIHWRVAA